ncbi:MAG TPA: glucose 1-dehydrogenase [Solirubrobacteraceae bacterium]|nr:glucose 1-dehydrogenase [Solirubrobacteraceae bacterium]
MDLGLEQKVAIVTGASRGLGRAAASALVAEGMRVLVVARDESSLQELVSEHPGAVEASACDVSDREAVQGLAAEAVRRFGRLDVVVNNAGVAPAGAFIEQDWDRWHEVLAVNVTAPAALAQAAGHVFVEQGSGKVINVASTSGVRGKPILAAYSASKAALIRFTEALASEWAPLGVQVNAIAPGAFATDAQAAVTSDPEMLARRLRKIPSRRMGDPGEFGPLVAFLASSASDFITGATFVIDGGEVSKL